MMATQVLVPVWAVKRMNGIVGVPTWSALIAHRWQTRWRLKMLAAASLSLHEGDVPMTHHGQGARRSQAHHRRSLMRLHAAGALRDCGGVLWGRSVLALFWNNARHGPSDARSIVRPSSIRLLNGRRGRAGRASWTDVAGLQRDGVIGTRVRRDVHAIAHLVM